MTPENEKIIGKIKGLFNLANDKNGNEHQAEAAMAKAYELLARHKLDKSDIMDFAKPGESYNKDNGFQYSKRMPTEWPYIHGILSEFFNIDTVRSFNASKNETIVWFIGKQDDIEIARVIYNQLYFQYKYLWEKYRQRTGAVTTDKRNYYQGLMMGLYRRLREQKKNIETELSLVIVKDPGVEQAKNKFFPETKSAVLAKYQPNEHIRQAGVSDSGKIQLNKAIAANNDNNGGRRMLLN